MAKRELVDSCQPFIISRYNVNSIFISLQFLSNFTLNRNMSFEYPKFYSFPPFFTLQPAAETRLQQLNLWRDFVVSYCSHFKCSEIVVASVIDTPLFRNDNISRSLNQRSVIEVLDYVASKGNGAWMAEDKSLFAVSVLRTVDVANAIYKWADKYGLIDGISTLAEISSGSESRGEIFHGLPDAVLHSALKELEKAGRAVLLEGDSLQELGVKFIA